jgi:hypothetical protein
MPEEVIKSGESGEFMLPAYRKAALLVGTYTALIFVLRYIAKVLITMADAAMSGTVGFTTAYIIKLAMSGMFLQVIPSILGAFMFRYLGKNARGIKSLYTIPKSNTRALGNFTAVYGFAQIFNVITLIVTYFLTSQADLTKQLNTVTDESSLGMAGAWAMAFMLVIIAPVFEEFMFRGLILNELKPYGNGLSIFVSGALFGIFHGNFQQCFYTAAAGIALGYIANVTGSIFPTTIIHMIMNGIGAVMILLMNTYSVQEYILNGNADDIPDADMVWVAFYGIFMVCVFILIIVGFIAALMKIKQIKRYRLKKVWGEVTNGKKLGILLCTVPAMISVIMIIDTYAGFSNKLISLLVYGKT